MDPKKILEADVLDIIFDGRNKEYGAYELRKTYNNRLRSALLVTGGLIVLLFLGYFLSGVLGNGNSKRNMIVQDVQLEDIKDKKVEPPVIPPPKVEPPKIEMVKFTPPKIVKDEEVKDEEKPPPQEKLEDTKISNANQEGVKDDGLTAPVPDAGKGVVVEPKKDETDYDKTFTKVEIESDYVGGPAAWLRYLHKNLNYPEEAQTSEIQGDVVVQFIVDKEGNVSDVTAISGPTELRDEAVRVIRKSGKWKPAIQNGRQVKSFKNQPIKFRLDTQ
jgi:protein TonB